jgi:hypothetical protein
MMLAPLRGNKQLIAPAGCNQAVALLRLLGVKRGLPGLQIGNQFLGPVNRHLIAYQEQYALIPHNRFVDLLALLTHDYPVRVRNRSGSLAA